MIVKTQCIFYDRTYISMLILCFPMLKYFIIQCLLQIIHQKPTLYKRVKNINIIRKNRKINGYKHSLIESYKNARI
jgi:hypothetical protein